MFAVLIKLNLDHNEQGRNVRIQAASDECCEGRSAVNPPCKALHNPGRDIKRCKVDGVV